MAVTAVGCVGAVVCWLAYLLPPPSASDFDQLWVAARAFAAGRDPYAAVIAWGHPFPLFYPLPAVLLALPFAWLPVAAARAVWAGLGAAALTAAAFRYRRGLGTVLLGAGFLNALVLSQWSPLLTAAVALPWLSLTWVAKPSVGLAYFIAYPSRRAAWLCGGLLALSLALWPRWPLAWLAALHTSFQAPLVLQRGGFVLLLALVRWRRPEARLLAALACVPQTISLYETVPLWLIPRNRWGGYFLAGTSLVCALAESWVVPRIGQPLAELTRARWPYIFALVYLPALVLVLWPRREPDL